MALLKGPSGKEIDAFAKALADQVSRRYPPAIQASSRQQMSPGRVTKILEDTYQRAVKYNAEHKLGTYKKARLGNAFKWELSEVGYSQQFIEVATEGLIVYLTRKPAAKSTA